MVNFIKSLFGKENFEDSLIGLAKFNYQNAKELDTPIVKKKKQKDLTISELLRRSC